MNLPDGGNFEDAFSIIESIPFTITDSQVQVAEDFGFQEEEYA